MRKGVASWEPRQAPTILANMHPLHRLAGAARIAAR